MDKSKYINKVDGHVLVLGGSGEIGAEVVRALVAHGATGVTITYNSNPEAAEALRSEAEAEGVKVHIGRVDQLDEKGFAAFLEEAVASVGEEIGVVVNAIGYSPNTPIEEQTLEEHHKVMDVNLHGPFFTARAAAVRMREKGVRGSIVIITSTNGVNSNSPISSHYDASKAGLVPHIRNLAFHFAPHGIRVNGVAPGWIDTKMNLTLPEDERKKEMLRIWSGRFASPHEIAMVIAFVAGTGGSYITGQNFMADGGYQ
jgi:NAD(P)-dependent dehydrogenase (short-subunit alcohol dehydrogenase family)